MLLYSASCGLVFPSFNHIVVFTIGQYVYYRVSKPGHLNLFILLIRFQHFLFLAIMVFANR
ncbi:hypothetical protein Holit_00181 [Hollandina sp. SP2]